MKIDKLTIGMWNIHGLYKDKIQDPAFVNIISSMHVVSLVETWSDKLTIPGFKLICNSQRIKKQKG